MEWETKFLISKPEIFHSFKINKEERKILGYVRIIENGTQTECKKVRIG
jgi:hypothetical protein